MDQNKRLDSEKMVRPYLESESKKEFLHHLDEIITDLYYLSKIITN